MVQYINDFDASITQRTSLISGACFTGLVFGTSAGFYRNNNLSMMFAFNPILGIVGSTVTLLLYKQIKRIFVHSGDPQEDLRYSWIMLGTGIMVGAMGGGTIYAAVDYTNLVTGMSLFALGLVLSTSLVSSYHWLKSRNTDQQQVVFDDSPAKNFFNPTLLKVLSITSGIAIPFLAFGTATTIFPSQSWLINFAFTTAILPATALGIPALLIQSFCKCAWGAESPTFAKSSIMSGWYCLGTSLSLSALANCIIYGATKELDIRI